MARNAKGRLALNGLGAIAGQVSNSPSVAGRSLANQYLLNTVGIFMPGKDGARSVGTGFMHRFIRPDLGRRP